MSKKTGPALYELISAAKVAEPKQSPDAPDPQKDDIDLDRNVLTPGTAIHMSIGTIGVAAAVGIALIIISYTMGYQKGVAIGEQARDEYGARLQGVFVEPPASTTQSNVPSASATTSTANTEWGPIFSDPRKPNYYHYVLANGTREGAKQLATFCRAKGLETYVVSGHNTRRFNVIAFPGSTDQNAPEMKLVQSTIHAIGQEWANTPEGRDRDLQDTYPIR